MMDVSQVLEGPEVLHKETPFISRESGGVPLRIHGHSWGLAAAPKPPSWGGLWGSQATWRLLGVCCPPDPLMWRAACGRRSQKPKRFHVTEQLQDEMVGPPPMPTSVT